ncbi:MAG: hypothetical protein ACXVHX_38880, partial [Solirubrobacteraceae bacterium]
NEGHHQGCRAGDPSALQGLIRRIPRSQRYQLTAFGRRTAVFFTKTHVRIVNPSLAELDPQLPKEIAHQSPIELAWI